jgi:hypothetical protein
VTYANVNDVAAELGRPAPTDPDVVAQWNRWLTRIENMIIARIPDLEARVTAGEITPGILADVEASAVARKILNPEGLRQVTKAIDDGSVTKIIDQSRSTGELGLTEDEWALLLPTADSGAFSTRPGFEPDTVAPWGVPWV